MIKVEPCGACGRITFQVPVANLRIKTDVEALEASGAVTALVDGRALYRVTYLGGKPYGLQGANQAVLGALHAEPGERPMVVQEHRCDPEAVRARLSAVQQPAGPGARTPAPKAPVAPSRPFSGPSTAPSGVPAAAPPRSDASRGAPRCDDCGLIMGDGEYVSIQIGEIYVWATHLMNCGG
jgi:hypothetical protein